MDYDRDDDRSEEELVDYIVQQLNDIVYQLNSLDLRVPESLGEDLDDFDKALRLADEVNKIRHVSPRIYCKYIEALKAAGPWTASLEDACAPTRKSTQSSTDEVNFSIKSGIGVHSSAVQSYCKRYGISSVDIDQEVGDEHILEIYPYLVKWKQVATKLGLKSSKIIEIEYENMQDRQLMRLCMLQKWKGRYVEVFFKDLLETLIECGCHGSANQVCHIIKEKETPLGQSAQLNELCRQYELKNDNKEVSDKFIFNIYPHLDKWKQVGAHLGLTQADIVKIESQAKPDKELMKLYMLQKWKTMRIQERGTPTCQVLLDALLKCGCTASAITICHIISPQVQFSDDQLLNLCSQLGITSYELNKEVSNEVIFEIYSQLENWKRVAIHLGLTHEDIEDIAIKAWLDEELMRLYMLQKWRRKKKITTYKILLKALLKCCCSGSAILLCGSITDRGTKRTDQTTQLEELYSQFSLRKEDYAKVVSDEHIAEIYTQLEKWEQVGTHLGFTQAEIVAIKEFASTDKELMRLCMLQCWKKKNSKKTATYQILLKTLLQCGCTMSAVNICYLLDNTKKSYDGQSSQLLDLFGLKSDVLNKEVSDEHIKLIHSYLDNNWKQVVLLLGLSQSDVELRAKQNPNRAKQNPNQTNPMVIDLLQEWKRRQKHNKKCTYQFLLKALMKAGCLEVIVLLNHDLSNSREADQVQLDDLYKEFDLNGSKDVSDEAILEIYPYLLKWKVLANKLGLIQDEVEEIETDSGNDRELMRLYMLRKWKGKQRPVTYKVLLEALLKSNLNRTAIHVCYIIHKSKDLLVHSVQLDDICKQFDLSTDDIDKEVTDEDILKIYPQLEKWKKVGAHLGLTYVDIIDIEQRAKPIQETAHLDGTYYAKPDEELMRLYMLQEWKGKGDETATYRVLLKALLKCNCTGSAIQVSYVISTTKICRKSSDSEEVSDEVIFDIYPNLEKWKRVGAHLGLTHQDIVDISCNAWPDEELMRLYMLQEWKRKESPATYQILLNALLACNCHGFAMQVDYHRKARISHRQHIQLEKLCNLNRDDLSREVCDEDILKIYPQLEKWKQVGAHLGLTQEEIVTIESWAKPDEELMRLRVLQKWKEIKNSSATYQELLKTLLQCNYTGSAIHICDILTKAKTTTQVESTQIADLYQRFKLNNKDLKNKVTEEVVVEIYPQLDKWKLVAAHLGLTQGAIEAIEVQAGSDKALMRQNMLQKWRKDEELDRTYEFLLDVLFNTGYLGSVLHVCDILTRKKDHIKDLLKDCYDLTENDLNKEVSDNHILNIYPYLGKWKLLGFARKHVQTIELEDKAKKENISMPQRLYMLMKLKRNKRYTLTYQVLLKALLSAGSKLLVKHVCKLLQESKQELNDPVRKESPEYQAVLKVKLDLVYTLLSNPGEEPRQSLINKKILSPEVKDEAVEIVAEITSAVKNNPANFEVMLTVFEQKCKFCQDIVEQLRKEHEQYSRHKDDEVEEVDERKDDKVEEVDGLEDGKVGKINGSYLSCCRKVLRVLTLVILFGIWFWHLNGFGSEPNGDEELPIRHPFCQLPHRNKTSDNTSENSRAPFAHVAPDDKLWLTNHGQDVLYIYIMNPAKLMAVGVNEQNILSWARKWEHHSYRKVIPKFMPTKSSSKSNIRIRIEPGGRSYSAIGVDAEGIDESEPTMTLGLIKGRHDYNTHIVVHEFGHALGMEHEHQRSKFWSIAKDFIDEEKMRSDPELADCDIDRDYLEQKLPGTGSPRYDPDSVMHYWFNRNWIKDERYHTEQGVKDDMNLTKEEKDILLGIHRRHKTFTEDPSDTDYKFLADCYQKKHSTPAPLNGSSAEDDISSTSGEKEKQDHGRKPITIETVKKKTGVTDEQLNKMIDTSDLHKLAGCFDQVGDYLDKLRLTPIEQSEIKKMESAEGSQSAMREALRKWHDKDRYSATYGTLINLTIELDKVNVAYNIANYIVTKQKDTLENKV